MKNQRLSWLDPDSQPDAFPDVEAAMREPNGLLAVGGDLCSERILAAYMRGIFPWYVEGQPILWWSPDPRCVLAPSEFRVSRRLARELRKSTWSVTFNKAFTNVIEACAEPREHQDGTWITGDIARAFTRLSEEGWAHSVEVWDGERLVGGIYGLAIDRVFFGESMFTRQTNGSKVAFLALCRELERRSFELVDCQVESPHLLTLGARLMPRRQFSRVLQHSCKMRWPLTDLPASATTAADLIGR